VAAPMFSALAGYTVSHLNIPPPVRSVAGSTDATVTTAPAMVGAGAGSAAATAAPRPGKTAGTDADDGAGQAVGGEGAGPP
jgi:hypothetical protein